MPESAGGFGMTEVLTKLRMDEPPNFHEGGATVVFFGRAVGGG